VNSVDDPVDAVDDSYSTDEDTPLTVAAPGVLGNDSYPDGFGSLAVVTPPAHGTLTLNQNGSFTYTPESNWNGIDSFVYRLTDSDGDSDTATVTITVNSVDDPVDAVDDSYSTDEDTPLTVAAPGVLGNDSYPDGFGSLAVVTPPAHGTLTLNQNGSFTYTPESNWNGTDSFVYRLTDSDGDSDTATVTITVNSVDDPVDAVDDSYSTDEDTPLTVAAPGVLGNDSYPDGFGSLAVVTPPAHGTLTLNQNGSFTYTPESNWNGTDSFVYRLTDSDGDSDTATVTITVNSVDDPVDAVDDSYSTDEDTPLTVAAPGVLGNDSYPDGFGSLAVVTPPAHGTLTLNQNGSFTYTPESNWNGIDSFVYRLTDSDGDSDTATVTITVNSVDDPVDAVDDSYSTDEDTPLTVAAPGVLGNDSYPDGFGSLAVVTPPAHGTLTLNQNGSFTYTPESNWNGIDSFVYRLTDSDGDSDTATVTITVNSVDDPVDAVDDSYSTDEDTPLTVAAPGVLGNDSYPDGFGSLAVVTPPAHGTLTLNQNGSFTYTPESNWNGTDSFVYRLTDSDGDSDTATVTITVNSVDDPVDAVDDSYSTDEDTPLTVAAPGVLGNDSYPDGFGSLAVVTPPAHGTLTLNQNGSFTYTPESNWNGIDSFVYRLTDSDGDSDTATVTITVNSVDDPVDAVDDSYSTDEDTPLTVAAPGVLGNDSYPDGFGSLAVVTPPAHGTLTLNQNGSFTYTPESNWNGTDSFVYRLTDSDGDSDTATVTITVNSVDDPVDAVDDSYSTDEDTPLTVAAPGVLGNDSYPDGFGSLAVVTPPAHGTLTLNQNGSFTYTPESNWNGIDSFVYRLTDSDGDSDTATVTITVNSVDDPVDAVDDSYSTDEDTPLTVAAPGVLGNDSYPDGFGSLTVVRGPSHGGLTQNPDGSFTCTPDPNFCGQDSFVYRLCDTDGDCDEATVTIHVTCVNDAPVAQDDSYTTDEDTPLLVPAPGILGNDYDVDGNELLTSVLVSGPAHGTLTLNSDGSFTYTPAENFCGEDSFTYKAYDGELYSNVATVTIHVTCVNDAPVAQDDSYTTDEDTPLLVPAPGVLGNDYDVDGNELLTSVLVSGPAHGTLTLNSDGSFTYTPAENFCGEDSFTYKAYDGELYSNVATVTINVTCVNDAPVAQDDHYTTDEDTPLLVPAPGILGNDYDVDGNELLTSVLVSGPAHGTLTLNPDGSFTYTPNPKFYGTDTFTYRVFDGELYSNVATVTITVSFVNDPMEASDISLRTCVNEGKAFEVQISDLDILWAGFTGYPVTFELISGPEHGTIAGDWNAVRYEEGAALLTLLYTPDANFIGSDELRIRAFDPYGQFVVFAVRITVESCGLTPAGAAGFVPGPVVIHEIAWAGTSASAEDQWIELRNLSDSPVNLEGWILRWRKKNPKTPEDLIWREIRLQGTIEPYGFFLLERGHDDVVKNIHADLIYPTVFRAGDKDLPLLFSVEGDVVELLNEKGELVDTANADPRRLEGWAAGSTLPASMERKSPFLPDLDENWHTNLGIVTFGKDRKENDLTATARNPNEPEILAIAGETLVVERGQKVALSRFVPNAPEAKVMVLRADVAGGAGALVPFDNEAFELRYDELVKTALVLLDTKALEPGSYKVVVSLGAGQYAVFSLVVR
jgi:VCBS repeat-containing protein